MGWKFRIEQTLYDRVMQVVGWQQRDNGRIAVIGPVSITVHDQSELLPIEQSFIRLPWDEAKAMLQGLVDAAFEAGIKPTGLEDFRRANDAQKAHLEDFRAIVSKTVGVVLPE